MQKMTKHRQDMVRPDDLVIQHLVGYPKNLVDTVLAAVFAGRPILLTGRHGTGKTRLFGLLARTLGYAAAEIVRYDASKDDMISVCGLPNAEKMQQGEFAFAEHPRCIYDKKMVMIDELTRATPETANLWLDIIEERSVFGRPLVNLANIVAAGNPGTEYDLASNMDPALRDRFYVVVEIPDLRHASSETIAAVAVKNLEAAQPEQDGRRRESFCTSAFQSRFRQCRLELAQSPTLRTTIAEWCGTLIQKLNDGSNYISPRTYGQQLPLLFLDVLAFLATADNKSPADVVYQAAENTAHFCVQTKCKIDPDLMQRAIEDACDVLRCWIDQLSELSDADRLAIGSFEDRLQSLRSLCRRKIHPIVIPHIRNFALELIEQDSSGDFTHRLLRTLKQMSLPDLIEEFELLLLNRKLDEIANIDWGRERKHPTESVGRHVAENDWDPATVW